MNAKDECFARDAAVDAAAIAPLPRSRKIHVEGSRPDVRVPMREIEQSDTPASFGAERNPAIVVYDTSGPYSDPAATIDIRKGLPPLRERWIVERDDTVALDGPTSAYGRARLDDPTLAGLRFDLHRRPRRAQPGRTVTQMHYARRGIVTPEMEFVAIRENPASRVDAGIAPRSRHATASRPVVRRRDPAGDHARVRPRRDRARPRDHSGEHQSPGDRADDHRPQLPGEDQRQHRQLGRHLVDRRGGREDDVGDALGRRHGDGPVDGQEHPRDPRVDRAQLAGADRHGADLPGAGEGRRPRRGTHLGDLPRHADRAGRAGRRLLHDPRRRAAPLRPDDRAAPDRHRLARRLDHGQVVPRAPPRELPLHAVRGHLRDHEGVRRRLLARRRAAARLDPRRQRRARRWRSSPRSAS